MEEPIRLILSDPLYIVLAGSVCIVVIFLILKKIAKLFLYVVLFLIAVTAYMYYSGESVATIVKSAELTVKKIEKSVQKRTAVEEVKKKAQKTNGE